MTDQPDPKPRRRGRPCKEPPWLKEVAEMVGRGTPLRRALWSKNILFTERELDVMSLIARGLSNREISRQLFISEGTVANYITAILGKTSLEHRTQIAIYYLTGSVN